MSIIVQRPVQQRGATAPTRPLAPLPAASSVPAAPFLIAFVSFSALLVTLFVIIALCGAQPVAAVQIRNVGVYNVSDPRIVVNYTKPVSLISKQLVLAGQATPYPLCQDPAAGEFTDQFTLYTRNQPTDPSISCTDPLAGPSTPLVPGFYSLTLAASDDENNPTVPNPPDIIAFTVQGLNITMLYPPSGISPVATFNLTIGTLDADASCRLSYNTMGAYDQTKFNGMTPASKEDTHTHTFYNINYNGNVLIACQEPSGRITFKNFTVGFDNTPPVITVTVTPTLVRYTSQNFADILVQTDDNTTCSVDGTPFPGEARYDYGSYRTLHEVQKTYAPADYPTPTNVTYTIACYNKVDLQNSTLANLTVDFSLSADIEMIVPDEGVNYWTSSVLPLVIRPTFDAASCTVNAGTPSATALTSDGQNFTGSFNLGPGLNIFNINCTGSKAAYRQVNITYDNQPPVPGTPAVIPALVLCDGNISAQLNFSAPFSIDHYNYTLTDASGNLIASGASASRYLSVPAVLSLPASVSWSATATDAAGLVSAPATATAALHFGEDGECGRPDFITLIAPYHGFARTRPYTVEIGTTRPAVCRYVNQAMSNWTWDQMLSMNDGAVGTDHTTKAPLNILDGQLIILCNETATTPGGQDIFHNKTIRVGVLSVPPTLDIAVDRDVITDWSTAYVQMTVDTGTQDTYCTHNATAVEAPPFESSPDTNQSAYTGLHTTVFNFRNGFDQYNQSKLYVKRYHISCKNLADLANTTDYSFTIFLGGGVGIAILFPDPSTDYVPASDTVLSVMPNKEASCAWTMNATDDYSKWLPFSSIDAGTGPRMQNVTLSGLTDGSYHYFVHCVSTDNSQDGINSTTFIVDTQPPVINNITGNATICPARPESYVVDKTTRDLHPTLNYTLYQGDTPVLSQQTLRNTITVSAKALDAGYYHLDVALTDRANRTSAVSSLPLNVLSANDTVCKNIVGNVCASDSDCGPGLHCGASGVCVPTVGGSCTSDADCVTGQACIIGQCIVQGASCTTNADCVSPDVCFGGYCTASPPTDLCKDGVLDGDESGIDCGGSCAACVTCSVDTDCSNDSSIVCIESVCVTVATHKACTDDSECPGQTCVKGICIGKAIDYCNDGIQDNGEQGIDCGPVCAKPCPVVSCTDSTNCTLSGQTCVNGVCTNSQNNDCVPACSSAQTCVSGVCIDTPPSQGKSHLLSILFIAFGLAVMGAVGYLLYQQDEEKKAAAMRRAAQASMQSPRQQGAQRTFVRQGPQAAGATAGTAGSAASAGHGAQRVSGQGGTAATQAADDTVTQRRSLLDAFDQGVPGSRGTTDNATQPTQRTQEPAQGKPSGAAVTQQSSGEPGGDDDFVDIEDIASLQKRMRAKFPQQDASSGQPGKDAAKGTAADETGGNGGGKIDGKSDNKGGAGKDDGRKGSGKDDDSKEVFDELDKLGK